MIKDAARLAIVIMIRKHNSVDLRIVNLICNAYNLSVL